MVAARAVGEAEIPLDSLGMAAFMLCKTCPDELPGCGASRSGEWNYRTKSATALDARPQVSVRLG